MTSWIWMKGIDIAIADPIDPVTPEDVRPSVKALIQEHKEKIQQIREGIASDALYDPTKHDDLWILRYHLSHKKKVKKAIEAALKTLQYRHEHKLDDTDIRATPPHKVKEGLVREFWTNRAAPNSLVFTHPDEKRGVVCFLNLLGMEDVHMENISDQAYEYGFVYLGEWSNQVQDYVTRTTGRLTKSVRFGEMKGVSLFSMNSKSMKAQKRDGKVMGRQEDYYPQMLETLFVCNPPAWVHVLWNVMRPILPQRIHDKIDLVSPKVNEKERKRVLKFLSYEHLPVAYGGENQVSPQDW